MDWKPIINKYRAGMPGESEAICSQMLSWVTTPTSMSDRQARCIQILETHISTGNAGHLGHFVRSIGTNVDLTGIALELLIDSALRFDCAREFIESFVGAMSPELGGIIFEGAIETGNGDVLLAALAVGATPTQSQVETLIGRSLSGRRQELVAFKSLITDYSYNWRSHFGFEAYADQSEVFGAVYMGASERYLLLASVLAGNKEMLGFLSSVTDVNGCKRMLELLDYPEGWVRALQPEMRTLVEDQFPAIASRFLNV